MLTAYVPRPQGSYDVSADNFEYATCTKDDPVDHPSHYTYGNIETIDFIEDKNLNFNRGNAIKYIVRAGHKNDEIQDLEKAVWYINHEIQRLKKGNNT